MNKVQLLVNSLKEKELTLALAESMTCGMASQKLSGMKGISEVFRGAVVCYSPEVKMTLMGIKQSLIEHYTCESMEVTEALAKKLSNVIPADIHAAITGLASPGGSETSTKPVGSVFFCIRYKKHCYKTKKILKGSPSQIKRKACIELYRLILHAIN